MVVLMPRRRTTQRRGAFHAAAFLAALVALAVTAPGCAPGGGAGHGEPLPGPAGRLDPIYDVMISFPDAVVTIAGLEHTGITVDLEATFDDETVRDGDPRFRAPVRVIGVTAGGLAQSFAVPQPIVMQGSIDGPAFETDLFGPIQFGTANLVLSLTGTIESPPRRIAGTAEILGTTTTGPFTAVRRRRYLVAGTDLSSPIGQAAVVDLRYDSQAALSDNIETISSDPVARVADGRPIVVNRLSFDNLQGLDPKAGFKTVFQDSTGNGSNPHDLAVLGAAAAGVAPGGPPARAGVAFVTRYGPPYDDLALFDLDDGALLDHIDLVPLARNPDHLPRADQVLLHDGLLWVTLQDANASFTQFMNGRLAVIDPAARAVVDVIDLSGQNPFESLVYAPETGLIYVGLAGIFPGLNAQSLTGGVEAIDPATRASRGLIVDDDALGGNVSAVAIASAARGYVVVTDAAFHNSLEAFDPGTGEVLGTVYDSPQYLAALVADDGFIVLAEHSDSDPRILILDGTSGRLVAIVPLRLPPVSLAVMTRTL
jgi:DNA-binding beta-propeller fold protein YncE